MNILITICGRKGSRGVKNKNIRKLVGIPLVNYTIAAACMFKEKQVEKEIDICINTDSSELIDIVSTDSNIVVVERPSELARDDSPKVPVISYSLKYMEKKLNKIYDYIIDLDITSPLRKVEDIENALKKVINSSEMDVVFSVVPSRKNPYFNMVEKKNGKIKRVVSSNYVTRQQAPMVYDMNASIYCYRRNALIDNIKKSPLEGRCGIVVMKDTAVLDIDSESDFELMEVIGGYYFKNDFKELYRYAGKIK